MKTFNLLVSVSFCSILAACATVYTNGPMAVVENPEVLSSDVTHLDLDFMLKPIDNIQFVTDASSRPLSPTLPPVLGQQETILGGFRLNTRSPFELGAALDPFVVLMGGGFGGLFFAKYQLLGPTNDRMESRSHLLGVSSHLVHYSQSLAGQQNGIFGPGGYPWSANSHFSGYDLGLSYGYRLSQQWMYYVGYAYQIFYADTNVNQTASSVGASPAYGAANYAIPASQGANTRSAIGVVVGGGKSRNIDAKFDLQIGYITSSWNQQKLGEWSFAAAIILPLIPKTNSKAAQTIEAPTAPVESPPPAPSEVPVELPK